MLLVACLVYYSTLKMDVVYSSETLVNFYESTLRHISENGTVCLSLDYCRAFDKLLRLLTTKEGLKEKLCCTKKIEEYFVYFKGQDWEVCTL